MDLDTYRRALEESSVLWVSACTDDNLPNVARAAGIAPVHSLPNITFYVSEAFTTGLLDLLHPDKYISLLTVSMHSFESYQFKGICQSIQLCTREDHERQRQHLSRFTTILAGIGIPGSETDKISQLYFQQPSHAITFDVKKIFLQTPKKGAGALLQAF